MNDYYSESNKQKFIITNKTDSIMTSEEFAKKLFEKIVRDAKDKFILTPGKSIMIECANDWENLFETYIVSNFGDAWGQGDSYSSDDIDIRHIDER